MSDRPRSRVEVNLNPRVRKAVLSSSMEYEEYLAQRMSSNDRRPSRGGLYDHTISSESRQRQGGMESKIDGDSRGDGRPPLQHSWRMHVNNDEEGVGGIVSGRHRVESKDDGDNGYEKVPQNPSEIALLMRQAKLSMEESIKRSNIIDQLITEGSSSSVDVDAERKSYLMSSMESLEDAYEYEDWTGRALLNSSTKIRTLTLKHAFNTLTSAVKSRRGIRESTVKQLQLDKKEALRKKYLQTWKLHAKEARISNSLQKDRLRKTLQGWKGVSEGRKRSLQLAEEQYKITTKARILDTFKELMITRRAEEKERMREEEHGRVSSHYRDQRLMQRAFEGLQKVSKMSVGQKELMEESASRRKRIATLVSALKSKEGSGMTTRKTPPRTKPFQKSNLSESEAKRKALAQQGPTYNRRSDLTDRLITLELESKRKGDNEKVSIQIPPIVPIAFSESRFLDGSDREEEGRSSRRSEGKEADDNNRGNKYGYNAKGQWDDGFDQSSFDDSEYDDYGMDDDGESLPRPPPPAYENTMPQNNNQKGRTGAKPVAKVRGTRTSELRALPPRGKNASSHARTDDASDRRNKTAPRQQMRESSRKVEEMSKKSGADIVPQEVLDDRAEKSRQRIRELRKQSQERVAKSTMEREREAKLKQDEEDMEFLQMQQERRAKLESLKQDTERTRKIEEAMKDKKEIASKFYLQKLLLRRGLQPWRELTDQARINWVKAMDYREDTLLQSTWIALYGYCRMQRSVRARQEYRQGSMAVAFYRRQLLKTMWLRWSLRRRLIKAKAKAVTGHFSKFTNVRRAFGAWTIAMEKQKRMEVHRMRAMVPRGNRSVLRYFWNKWSLFHEDALFEKEVARRTDSMMARVQTYL